MIDDHCHPFALQGGTLDLAQISLDVGTDPDADDRRRALGAGRLFQELVSVRLAEYLRCDVGDLPAARGDAAGDWPAYVAGLFRDCGLTGLIMDPSHPPGAEQRLSDYAEMAGCPVHAIMRIDPIVDRMIGDGASAGEIVEQVGRDMSAAAGGGAVGFKTILAYRTGLAIDPEATVEQADRGLADDAALPVRRRGKACRDLVMRAALGTAADLGLPFQFHTGIGDSEIRLAEANPLLLEDLLRTPEGSGGRVVLIHGSYPWHGELAYLAATKPNVWADLSLSNIFAPATVADRLLRILELAPAGRVLLATDGHGAPETFWFAAHLLRRGWAEVRATLARGGAREPWLDECERRTFEDNARELYGI
jgi:hypothetical protein